MLSPVLFGSVRFPGRRGRRGRLVSSAAGILVASLALATAPAASAPGASAATLAKAAAGTVTVRTATVTAGSWSFVTRSGNQLMLDGRPFRFSGANIYWGGLDENGRTSLNYPTPLRADSALATVAGMGGTVVRCQTCGISTGNPYSVEPAPGVFNQTALRHIDYFVAQAQKYGIRLDIPLTDNYNYYLGGYHNFTDWLGLSSASDCPSTACASTFYTNPKAIAAFEQYIAVLLNHVNVYTGIPNKDNPAIMSWETGNELPMGSGGAAEFTAWTSTISTYIKSIAPRQLVMDGGFDLGDLTLPDVDIQSPHFYPISTRSLSQVLSLLSSPDQALVIGEYAWNNPDPTTGLAPFLAEIENTPAISGDVYWDLFPQNDDFGYTEHYDGYQLHFPGDDTDVGNGNGMGAPVLSGTSDAAMVTELRDHAYAMSGRTAPPYPVPSAPVITNVEHVTSSTVGDGNLVEWRGSAGAVSYLVRRSTMGPLGPWTTVCSACGDTNNEPFLDPGAPDGPRAWYQVTAVNLAGVAGLRSAPFQLTVRTLDDNLSDFSKSHSHSADLTMDESSPSLYAGDPARADSPAGTVADGITWHVRTPRTFEAVGYYENTTADTPSQDVAQAGQVISGLEGVPEPSTRHFRFLVSRSGAGWTLVPATDVQVNWGGSAAAGDWTPYIYTIDDIQRILPGAQYVRVQWDSNAPGIAELGEVRVTYP
jgi:hypothetical protein